MKSSFNWNDIQYFLAVVRTQTIGRAAKQLGTDLTTVSRRIQALEEALGATLFDRSNTGYRLTQFGESLLASAEKMEGASLSAIADLQDANGRLHGVVRIGAPDGVGSFFLAPRMASLCDLHPELTVELVVVPQALNLAKHEADIVISRSPALKGRLVSSRIAEYRIGLFARDDYLASRPEIKDIAGLAGHRVIGHVVDYVFIDDPHEIQSIQKIKPSTLRISNALARLQSVLAGRGICLLPYFVANKFKELRPVLPGEFSETRSFWMLVHEDRHRLSRVRTTSDFIREAFALERRSFLHLD